MSGWYFENVVKIDTSITDAVIIDGHVWTTNGSKVTVWNIWGDVDDKKDVERTEFTDLTAPDFRGAVKVIEFTVNNGAGKLCDAGNKVWITNDTTPNSMVYVLKDFSNVASGALAYNPWDVVQLPEAMWSDFTYAYGKMWMVSQQDLPNAQILYFFDGSSFGSTTIPDKPQQAPVRIVDGKNGFIYITRYNNVSVAKFASSNGSYIGSVRVNAEPTSLYVSDDGILVGSYAGMVSVINPSNDVVTHTYSTVSVAQDIVDTGDGYLWSITDDGKGFIRIKKSDKSITYTVAGFATAPQADYTFETTDFKGEKIFNKLMYTLPHTMTYWTGSAMASTTAYGRLVFTTNNNVYLIRNYGSLNRKPYTELGAYGYITSGPYDYAGD